MSELEQDLQATSEDLVADAKQLVLLEERKMALRPDDPQVLEVSLQAEELVEQMETKGDVELALATELQAERARP